MRRRPVPSRSATIWLAAGLLAGLAAAALVATSALARLREAADTDARIVHRLLSQRAAQHDAVLATLDLLQPAQAQRLPAVYPQVLAVLQRPPRQPWDDPALREADDRARAAGHAVPARGDLGAGRVTLVQHGEPSSHALRIDLRAMVPWAEWPMGRDAPARVELVSEAAGAFVLQPGAPAGGPWPWSFRKRLASPSQPFDVVVSRAFGPADLPWARMAGAVALVGAALGAAALARQQLAARRRAEDLLRLGQVARLNTLGELAAGIAHELNQPLTAVLASTQAARRLIEDGPEGAAQLGAALDQAVAQARRASEVLRRLRRSVERPDAGRHLQPVALEAVVADTLHLLAPEAARRGVAPEVRAPEPVRVLGDPVAVQQIVHNLAMNALQALEQPEAQAPPRRLVMAVAAEGGEGVLRVADTGPGLAPEVLPRLFEPFFTTRPGGLGLGLSLCEGLAQGMGGSLAAGPTPLGPRGACFTLRLLRARTTPEDPPP